MYQSECVVIGAGVIGLSVARAISAMGKEVLVLEAEHTFGTGVSSRSSEVIHSGIYYPPNSRKARLCVRGRELLYSYCAYRGIAHNRCGKLIVATESHQVDTLAGLHSKGLAIASNHTVRASLLP